MDNSATKPTVYPTARRPYSPPILRQLAGQERDRAAQRLAAAMKLHVLGVPHTITRRDFSTCAFTQKVLKLCAMMTRRGHEVIHYGVEGAEVECTQHVDIITQAEWSRLYSHPGKDNYNIREDGPQAAYAELFAQRLNAALKRHTGAPYTEILCMTWGGRGQRGGIEGIPQFEVETGIGYRHSWAPTYRVYESYAWLHMHLGVDNNFNDPRWYWAVIPNAFDLQDFEFNANPGDDFLYMGRLNADKGIGLAIQVAKEVGRKITIVGQGDPTPFLAGNPHVTYLPPVGPEERQKLLGNAYAVFCPTFYVEPFCGVNVEAQLCGTPVITSDHGVFPETVHHGVTGWRCRNLEQFVWAAKNVDKLDRVRTRCWATENFSLERVALMYEEYFQSVLNVRIQPGTEAGDVGFYLPHPDRQQLDWLKKVEPETGEIDLNIQHIPPPPLAPKPKKEGWEADQDWERHWWGLEWGPHWDEEIKKQETYFRLMGMPDAISVRDFGSLLGMPDAVTNAVGGIRDFGSKTVLDVGCGPVSLLQRSKHGFARGVDPLAVSDATRKRYADAGVEFLNIKAEEMPIPGSVMGRMFDEVWFYNCLQHTDDPNEILRRVVNCTHVGSIVRAFEWIDLGVCPGHPQNLTEDMFWKVFGGDGWERPIWNQGFLRNFGGTLTDKYLAFVAVKK